MKSDRSRLMRITTCAFRMAACGLLWATVGFAQEPQPKDVDVSVEKNSASWKEFSSNAGAFAIKFPGIPKESTQPVGEFTLKLHQLRTSFEYSVMYADYPEWISDKDPVLAKRVLDSGLEGAVAEVKAKLLDVEEITLNNHPGRRYTERMPDGSIMRGKTFLVGHRLYQIAITTPKEESAEPENIRFYREIANKFLESFRLIKSQG
jgi:hypothetical protein